MDKEQTTDNVDGATEEQTTDNSQELSNADIKNNPLFLKVTKELSELHKREELRKAKEEEKQKETELKKAEEEGRYQDALKQRDEEISKLKNENLFAQIKAALLSKGSKASEGFFKVAMAEYNSESYESLDDFADALKNNENYNAFFGESERVPHAPPNKIAVNGGGGQTLTQEKVRSYEQSTNPEERKIARDYLRNYYKENGKMPY